MFVQRDNVRLFYDEQGEGRPLVLIHGLGLNHDMWRHQVPALAERNRVINVDARGHGQSDAPPGPYTTDDYVEDLRALLDALDIDRPVLIGLSMGGGIVQSFALKYPQRVFALGLVSTGSEFAPVSRQRFQTWADAVERSGIAAIAGSMRDYFVPAFADAHPDVVAWTEEIGAATDPHGFAAAARANAARDWTERLGEFTCPVLFVGGELDRGDTAGKVKRYRERVKDLEVHVIPGVAHLLCLEMPDKLNDILLGFLKRIGY